MTDARAQLLSVIEAAVTDTLDRQLAGIAEDLAERVADRLATTDHANGTPKPEWIDAAEVARRYGTSRDYVYENAERLGARRLGDGPRARLRFNPELVAEALAARPHPATKAEPQRTQRRPRRLRSRPDLLPIRGRP